MSKEYICVAPNKEIFNIKGESLGMEGERALYYAYDIGRHRIYRSHYPIPDFGKFRLFKYKRRETAQKLCDEINKVYNDDFKVVELCNKTEYEKVREWKLKNKDKVKEQQRRYRLKNKDKLNEYRRNRYKKLKQLEDK